MLYQAYEAQSDFLAPLRAFADLTRTAFGDTSVGPAGNFWFKGFAAGAEIASSHFVHERPDYGIGDAPFDGGIVQVVEEITLATPFGNLTHFRKKTNAHQPRVLIVAPMAGHFPTLLRQTAQTMLADHDVYITDWKSGRDMPLSAGRFGIDEYIDHVIRFLEKIGPGAHVVAVCQPCVAVLAAVAIMSEDGNKAVPRSMTLMAGPVDTRVDPTGVNRLATGHPIAWFERNFISTVSRRHAGAHRRVYPGFVQLSAFLLMNLSRHVQAHMDLFGHILKGEDERADASRKFYKEYFSVADLPAEFYLETVQKVFQQHLLARGLLDYRGRKVDLAAIRETALLTVEGECDDICSVGQTAAAHDLCAGIEPSRKKHYVQADVGHYGVFSGSRWQNRIYPMVRDTVLAGE